MECYCYLRNIQDLMSDGKTPYERRFGMPFNGPDISFGAMVEYHPYLCERPVRKSHIRTKKLDVQETNIFLTQFNGIWDYFSWCRLTQDGIPALDLWDLVIDVFHSSPNQLMKSKGRVQVNLSRDTPSNKHTQNQTKTPIHHDNLEVGNVDYVSSNVKSSQFGAMLCIFEDSEAVMKMIVKGRSPTMRHLSRTHRVAPDRINLDLKIQIKYVDTKRQLADILTKGNFTRDEWNNLVHLFNNGDFSLICCSQNFSSTSCPETMAKRIQEEKGEGRIVAKSKPTLKLVSHAATSSSTVQSPIASKSLGTLRAPCHPDWKRTGKLVAREHNQDAASCSQVW